MFFCFYWYSFSRYGAFLDFFVLYISEEVGNSLGKSLSGFLCFICSLFFILLLMNFSGLIPYVFGSTSHLLVSLSFGLVM